MESDFHKLYGSRFFGICMSKRITAAIVLCLFLSLCFFAGGAISLFASVPASQTHDASSHPICIVLDAGHGGCDPGKIGVDNTPEKEINLAIVQRLKSVLTNRDIRVVLTRDNDTALTDGFTDGSKREDMYHRLAIIEKANANFTISIHQNSYPDSSVCGPQVFYYSKSEEGAILADAIQQSLNQTLQPANPRESKANDEYFMLKKTPTPTVIVECGFLSNPAETALLTTESYRDLVVRAIYFGIDNYLQSDTSNP